MRNHSNLGSILKGAALGAGLLGLTAATAYAGIADTKHNLGSTGTAAQWQATNTAEICVFCHTPHGSDTSAPAPLWNKSFPAAASYNSTRYSDLNTSTLDGTEAPVGSVSLACLSCHDGSQAMDVVINAPGSGGYNASGASFDSGPGMTGSPIPMLGTDLRNDHPISIQYAGGGCADATAGDGSVDACGALGDPDFNATSSAEINGNPQWWVDTGGAGVREKSDMILYTRNDAIGGSGTVEPFVECASCHDPHVAAQNANEVAFLRVSQAGSGVCLACHNK